MNVCPHTAISMKADKYGFFYPDINQDKCVDCGLCVATCPVHHPINIVYPKECYAVICKEKDELRKVASGGMASLLSHYVLSRGGVVYGADGTDIRNVHHTRIDKDDDIDKLRGSKYVQSYMGETYKQVKKDLRDGRLVLYTGTPCQVAGLKAFLHNKMYANLITVDLVCHGVPSQKMLNDDIDLYTSEKGDKLDVVFRMKPLLTYPSEGSNSIKFGMNIKSLNYGFFLGGAPAEKTGWKIQKPYNKDPYMIGFIGCLTFRPNCYKCRYACAARCGDFTVADFWGLSQKAGLDNTNGVSLALLNSEQAVNVWKEVSKLGTYVKRDIVEALVGNGQLQRPSSKPITYEMFRQLYPEMSFKKAIYKSSKPFFKKEKKQKIKAIIKKILLRK